MYLCERVASVDQRAPRATKATSVLLCLCAANKPSGQYRASHLSYDDDVGVFVVQFYARLDDVNTSTHQRREPSNEMKTREVLLLWCTVAASIAMTVCENGRLRVRVYAFYVAHQRCAAP